MTNILFIVADQFRHDFLGCAGADFVDTPTIDRIAQDGTRFTNCCTVAAICSPARIALATGNYPWRTGLPNNDAYLPASARTFYQRFRDADYRVGCVGKLDLAKPSNFIGFGGDRPVTYAYGFTHPVETEGKMHSGNHPTPQGPYGKMLDDKGWYQAYHTDYRARAKTRWIKNATHDSVLPDDLFQDTYIGDRAVHWIDEISSDRPWMLFLSFVGPHDPFDPPKRYADRYRNRPMPSPIKDDWTNKPRWPERLRLGLSDDETLVARRQYCASIAAIDDAIGRTLDAVRRKGGADETLIVFTADHGEMLGDHGIYQKHIPYESSMRIPLIVSGPGIQRGIVSDALVELIDINPTLCEYTGLPAQENIDARSFSGILSGDADTHRDDVFCSETNYSAIRTREYKYIENVNDKSELYRLMDDPNELNNRIDSDPDIVRDMRNRLKARYTSAEWRR
ncbi:MAG: sulfatase-like hydrolase/transferase [Planctomycetota bacterium]